MKKMMDKIGVTEEIEISLQLLCPPSEVLDDLEITKDITKKWMEGMLHKIKDKLKPQKNEVVKVSLSLREDNPVLVISKSTFLPVRSIESILTGKGEEDDLPLSGAERLIVVHRKGHLKLRKLEVKEQIAGDVTRIEFY